MIYRQMEIDYHKRYSFTYNYYFRESRNTVKWQCINIKGTYLNTMIISENPDTQSNNNILPWKVLTYTTFLFQRIQIHSQSAIDHHETNMELRAEYKAKDDEETTDYCQSENHTILIISENPDTQSKCYRSSWNIYGTPRWVQSQVWPGNNW